MKFITLKLRGGGGLLIGRAGAMITWLCIVMLTPLVPLLANHQHLLEKKALIFWMVLVHFSVNQKSKGKF